MRLSNEADKIAEDKTLKTFNLYKFRNRKDEIGNLAQSFHLKISQK